MGTDIHFYVERHVNGKWETCDKWSKSEYNEEGDDSLSVAYKDHFYDGRNYDLFAILADVRNGTGFAGCVTGGGFIPISQPRGWPKDCCPELQAVGEQIDHTPTWLTVDEIMAFDWTRKAQKFGVVGLKEWARWKINGKPSNWSDGVFGPGVIHKPESAFSLVWESVRKEPTHKPYDIMRGEGPLFDAMVRKLGGDPAVKTFDDTGKVYTNVQWEISYYDAGTDFLGTTLPRLWRLGKPEDVRCVFYFDS